MSTIPPNPLTRDDTLLGVCQALAEDFGLNPIFLRIGFGLLLFWHPDAALGAYFGLGIVVLLSRLLAPNPRRARVEGPGTARAPSRGENDDGEAMAAAA